MIVQGNFNNAYRINLDRTNEEMSFRFERIRIHVNESQTGRLKLLCILYCWLSRVHRDLALPSHVFEESCDRYFLLVSLPFGLLYQ